MRLYPKNEAVQAIDHPRWGRFEKQEHGGFDLPDEMSDELHSFRHRGAPIWENEEERSVRLHQTDLERRRDPATLLAGFEDFAGALGRLAAQVPGVAAAQLDPAAELAALKARVAELEAVPPAGDAEDAAPAKAPARSKSAAKA